MRIPKLDEETTMKAALYHLGRYAASRAGLAEVLARRAKRAEMRGAEVNEAEVKAVIAQVVEKLAKSGYLNDQLFVETKVAGLRRQGRSARQVALKLREKGVAGAEFDASPEAELAAARAYVKRRRLGKNAELYNKNLAALARAGFSLAIARQALESKEA
jgi:regulatory protein